MQPRLILKAEDAELICRGLLPDYKSNKYLLKIQQTKRAITILNIYESNHC